LIYVYNIFIWFIYRIWHKIISKFTLSIWSLRIFSIAKGKIPKFGLFVQFTSENCIYNCIYPFLRTSKRNQKSHNCLQYPENATSETKRTL